LEKSVLVYISMSIYKLLSYIRIFKTQITGKTSLYKYKATYHWRNKTNAANISQESVKLLILTDTIKDPQTITSESFLMESPSD